MDRGQRKRRGTGIAAASAVLTAVATSIATQTLAQEVPATDPAVAEADPCAVLPPEPTTVSDVLDELQDGLAVRLDGRLVDDLPDHHLLLDDGTGLLALAWDPELPEAVFDVDLVILGTVDPDGFLTFPELDVDAVCPPPRLPPDTTVVPPDATAPPASSEPTDGPADPSTTTPASSDATPPTTEPAAPAGTTTDTASTTAGTTAGATSTSTRTGDAGGSVDGSTSTSATSSTTSAPGAPQTTPPIVASVPGADPIDPDPGQPGLPDTPIEGWPLRLIEFPVAGPVTYYDDWGACRGGAGCPRQHIGNDLIGQRLQPLLAPVDGLVTHLVLDHPTAGWGLVVTDAEGWDYRYYHVNNDAPHTDDGSDPVEWRLAPDITEGASVRAGQVVAYMGDSGNSEGSVPHLHFEIHRPDGSPVNPYLSLRLAEWMDRCEQPSDPGTLGLVPIPPPANADVAVRTKTGLGTFLLGTDGSSFALGDAGSVGWSRHAATDPPCLP